MRLGVQNYADLSSLEVNATESKQTPYLIILMKVKDVSTGKFKLFGRHKFT